MVQTQEQCKNSGPNTRGLKPFKPGQSGNPKGRPKGSGKLKQRFMKLLNEKSENDKGLTRWQIFINSQIRRAISGNQSAARNIWQYALGKPKDQDAAPGSNKKNPVCMNVGLAEHIQDRDIEDLELDRKHRDDMR